MRVVTVVSALLGAGTHVVGEPGGPCVVVDPGFGVTEEVVALLARDRLRARAVLLSHGHVDHTWDAAELSARLGVPVLLHAGDAHRLADPVGTLGPLGHQLAAMTGLAAPPAPADVRPFDAAPGEAVELRWEPDEHDDDGAAPLVLRALSCPGHTQGSTVYLTGDDDAPVALTGDVLFAGSMGRTDLPGGDPAAMAATLARLTTLDPRTVIHPGHGPSSTIAAELATNPYLRAAR